jgi:2-keto-4-pentenoate hydratase/2-oxohepta-3-ene-1,7-dioic acid hydratase in catechol pathway
MRICRYDDERVGLVLGDQVFDATAALDALPAQRWPLPLGDQLVAELAMLRPRLELAARGAKAKSVTAVRLLSPVANPTKIIGAPVNYAKHMDEVLTDRQLHHGADAKPIETIGLFLKATSSLVGPGEGVALRMTDRRNDHEVELAVIVGKRADRVSRDTALSYVAGYCIGLDMTVRGKEERSLRKSIDSYTVLGPWLVTADEVQNPGDLDLAISINGELRQSSNTRHLIFDVPRLIEYASCFYTLHPGDIIMTGTPEGVSPVLPGDRMDAQIEEIGSMTVQVRAADRPFADQ